MGLDASPEITKVRSDVGNDNTIYSPSLKEKNICAWGARLCPWWLDYPLEVIVKQEKELHESKVLYALLYVHIFSTNIEMVCVSMHVSVHSMMHIGFKEETHDTR